MAQRLPRCRSALCAAGEDQARHFLSVVPTGQVELPIAVDLELIGNCEERPSEEQVIRELEDFLAIVEGASGEPALLYIGPEFVELYPGVDGFDRPRWVLSYLRRPDDDTWSIWQVGGYARVQGIDGKVDLDVAR